jgi:hypothetical protein
MRWLERPLRGGTDSPTDRCEAVSCLFCLKNYSGRCLCRSRMSLDSVSTKAVRLSPGRRDYLRGMARIMVNVGWTGAVVRWHYQIVQLASSLLVLILSAIVCNNRFYGSACLVSRASNIRADRRKLLNPRRCHASSYKRLRSVQLVYTLLHAR